MRRVQLAALLVVFMAGPAAGQVDWSASTGSLYWDARADADFYHDGTRMGSYGRAYYREPEPYYPPMPGPPPAWMLSYQRAMVMKSQFYSQFYRQQANMAWLVYRRADHRARKLDLIRSRQQPRF